MNLLGYINENEITDNSKQKKSKLIKNKKNEIKSHERKRRFNSQTVA